MPDSFKIFPANRYEALTMLYLQQQDISDLSPEQLYRKYLEVYTAIQQEATSPAQH